MRCVSYDIEVYIYSKWSDYFK